MESPHTSPRPVRLYILDDQPIFRAAVQRFFDLEPDVQVVGVAAARADVFPTLAEARPDVILYDPGRRGDDVGAQLAQLRQHCPGASLIVLTMDFGFETERTVLAAGGDAFVSKECTVEDLRAAVLVAAVNRLDGATRSVEDSRPSLPPLGDSALSS